jgi:hypothetical protein
VNKSYQLPEPDGYIHPALTVISAEDPGRTYKRTTYTKVWRIFAGREICFWKETEVVGGEPICYDWEQYDTNSEAFKAIR